MRYVPNQSGIWRVENEIAAPYAINAQGWNSGAGDYVVARTPGVGRVAVVGDSMVEAMQVPHDKSMSERLAEELSRDGKRSEVYRFAVSGAPLSQYLYMIEREVLSYRPDWIVVVMTHNDFDEMFQFVQGRYTSSFLKLRVTDGKVEEIPPVPWKAGADRMGAPHRHRPLPVLPLAGADRHASESCSSLPRAPTRTRLGRPISRASPCCEQLPDHHGDHRLRVRPPGRAVTRARDARAPRAGRRARRDLFGPPERPADV